MSPVPPEIRRRAAELFHEALEQPSDRRDAHLEAGASGDAAMLACARALLRSHELLGDIDNGEDVAPLALDEEGAPRRLRRGDTVGSYTIVERVGSGAMGVVYRAKHAQLERDVAVKVLRPGFASPSRRARLQREAVALARLRHPAIAAVHDAGFRDEGDDGGPAEAWIAMEFVDGRPIDDYCRVHRLPAREILRLVAVVADGLQHAHERGVIHRDVKPSNILVDAAGSPRILDFGVARVADSDIHSTTLETSARSVVGTLPFMSLEQVEGRLADIDGRTDVYGLGALAYTLLAGRAPFQLADTTLTEAVRIVREDDPPRLASLVRSLRGDCDTMVRKAMAREMDRRYQSAALFAADLRRHLEGRPIHARPPGPVAQLAMWARRNRPLASAIAAGCVVLAAGTAATTWQTLRATEAQLRAERRLEDARQLAATMSRDFYDALRAVPGGVAARRLVADESIARLESFAAETDDPAVLRTLADAYMRGAEVYGDGRSVGNLGEHRRAHETYARAAALYERLVASSPGDRELRRSHARAVFKRAAVGDGSVVDVADTTRFEEALELQERLLAEDPRDQETALHLAETLLDRAIAVRLGAGAAAAEPVFSRALRIATAAHAALRRVDSAVLLGSIAFRLGYFHAEDGDGRAAIAWYDSAIEALLPFDSPGERQTDVRKWLIALRAELARASALAGDEDRALREGAEGIVMATRDSADDPLDGIATRHVMMANFRMAEAHHILAARGSGGAAAARHWAQAAEHYGAAIEIQGERVRRNLAPQWELPYADRFEDRRAACLSGLELATSSDR